MTTAHLEASVMPSPTSNCRFRRALDGSIEFSIRCRNRSVTAWMVAMSETPVFCVEDVAVIPPCDDARPKLSLPSSFVGAWVEENGLLRHLGRAEYLRTMQLPALLEYSHGRASFCTRASDGTLIFSSAVSPAGAIGVHHKILAALPPCCKRALSSHSSVFRGLISEKLFTAENGLSEATPAASQALDIIKSNNKPVYARGEMDDCFVWAFSPSRESFIVAGVAQKPTTLTILFPFLPPDTSWSAKWIDDNQDFYTKGDLQIRPDDVSQKTKAVIKTLSHGGFVLQLCLKR